jgi:hypothetical protein
MWARSLGAAFVVLTSTHAFAAGGADAVQRAAEHFDEGSRAFQAKRFEQAASHFEAAFSAVPNARVLRNAMRARDAANQAARASTLAALALARYPEDADTMRVASDLLAKHGQSLAYLNVRCSSPCLLAANGLAVLGGIDAQHSIYQNPGKVRLVASFAKGGEAEQSIEARAGATIDVELSPVTEDEPEEAPRPAAGASSDRKSAPKPDVPSAQPPKRLDPPMASTPESRPVSTVAASFEDESPWYRSRGLFVTALVATAGVGGATAWSGIDTLRNPGTDAVRQACVGLGTACPEYQEGLAKQTRTNILIGATAGAGLATLLIGTLLTDFSSDEERRVSLSFSGGPDGFSGALNGSF